MPTTTLPADAHGTSLWHDLLPFLDPAVNALPARDRDAILLRYFQAKPIRDVAAALNISEDAAKQRCSRAVEKLRRYFTARGLTTPAAAQTTPLLAHTTTHAAPPAVISAVCGFALPTTAAPAISLLAHKTLLATQLKPLAATLAVVATALVLLGTGAALLLASPPAPAPAPAPPARNVATTTTAPTTRPIDHAAAALVREVRAAESWIDAVKSLQLTIEFAWLPKAPAANAPAEPPKPPETKVIGFDDHRFFYRAENTPSRLLVRRTWDGAVAVAQERIATKDGHRDVYGLEDNPRSVPGSFMPSLSWLRAGPQHVWWKDPKEQPDAEDIFGGAPEDFRITGRQTFRGVECHVVESPIYARTLYVGVADHRLYRLTYRSFPQRGSTAGLTVTAYIAREMGAQVTTRAQQDAWLKSLAPADRNRFDHELFTRLRPRSRPFGDHWYADYKEVAPNCWMPMRQGFDDFDRTVQPPAEPPVRSSADIRISNVRVNQPLPDDAFAWQFTEGATVYDRRTPGTLEYTYKNQIDPAEWDRVAGDATDRAARHHPKRFDIAVQLAARNALNKPAPEFPAGATWINSKPLRTADLAGKVTIVEFWSSVTQLSRSDVPKLNALHAAGGAGDVTIISVHAAGTPADRVRQWVQANKVTYPVCIDIPADKGPWDATLFTAYGVLDVPLACVIDPRGNLVVAGPLPAARKLIPNVPNGL
jgi:hypothetical protein